MEEARAACEGAEAVLIAAGAGIGVDSGLPDFRGNEGFWRAYPPYRHLGFSFMEMASPARFAEAPDLAWGFYGHRLELYRKTQPHEGYVRLLEYAQSRPAGYFVFTSNVDGQFQTAGVLEDRMMECHGSIRHLQCFENCQGRVWSADALTVAVDAKTMRAKEPLPRCSACGGQARPNILMFGDWGWNGSRTEAQQARFRDWLRGLSGGPRPRWSWSLAPARRCRRSDACRSALPRRPRAAWSASIPGKRKCRRTGRMSVSR